MKAAAPGYTGQFFNEKYAHTPVFPSSFVWDFGYKANSFRGHNDMSRWLLDSNSSMGHNLTAYQQVPISACNDFGNQILVHRPLALANQINKT